MSRGKAVPNVTRLRSVRELPTRVAEEAFSQPMLPHLGMARPAMGEVIGATTLYKSLTLQACVSFQAVQRLQPRPVRGREVLSSCSLPVKQPTNGSTCIMANRILFALLLAAACG